MKTIAFTFLALSALALAGESYKYIRRDVPVGAALNLQEFGGPNITVSVKDAQITFVLASVSDYTRLVPVARTTIQSVTLDNYPRANVAYSSEIAMVPTVRTCQVEKKNGIPFPGTRFDMYLLHADQPSGVRLYFLDTISPLNHNSVVVAVPVSPVPQPSQAHPTESATPPASTKIEPTPRQTGDGVVSSELLAWYFRLQKARQSLDTTNPEAVARFNKTAAEYHEALKRARASSKPQ